MTSFVMEYTISYAAGSGLVWVGAPNLPRMGCTFYPALPYTIQEMKLRLRRLPRQLLRLENMGG
ncbi:hypothetical protein [Paenibacillus lutrae]|uniref:Uncharacterized protein n=1 Tax=Paenibacillus lutrae TaxID=2078573 RepID=A0A7X3FG68_9BACL|nr:hypothetical protein [Paenibacillus lutrae]MVO99012.1 hypothetical protein [Paenibacillus lutrae]